MTNEEIDFKIHSNREKINKALHSELPIIEIDQLVRTLAHQNVLLQEQKIKNHSEQVNKTN